MDAIGRPEALRVRECDVAEIVRQLLPLLAYLHLNDITHRDVEVENILYSKIGDAYKTKDIRSISTAHTPRSLPLVGPRRVWYTSTP